MITKQSYFYTIDELKELCKQYPNDMNLGEALRKLLNN